MKRRRVLQLGAALGGGLLAQKEASARELGRPLGPYGERSPFERGVRWTRESKTPEAGSSFTPLAESHGILTPSSLHYERHHAGIPNIDPSRHRLVIQGMVERPLLLTVDEIKRLIVEAGRVPVERDTLYHQIHREEGNRWKKGSRMIALA